MFPVLPQNPHRASVLRTEQLEISPSLARRGNLFWRRYKQEQPGKVQVHRTYMLQHTPASKISKELRRAQLLFPVKLILSRVFYNVL